MRYIVATTLLTPLETIERVAVAVEDGIIQRVCSRESLELPADADVLTLPDGQILAPGFIDIHIHGNAGHDVMEGDDSSLSVVERSLLKHGVTSYCPTTVTAPIDVTLQSLEKIGKRCASGPAGRAQALGIHLEGPFLSHAKRGVHPPDQLRDADPQLFENFWQAANGTIRVMTIAPEIKGALETIRMAAKRNVVCSIGHSDADFDQSRAAIAAGATHATHTFNAMRALDHREPGILGAVLSSDEITADIIADGVHVAPAMVATFMRAKGIERSVLITDAISATGMGDGRYMLGKLEVEVRGNRAEHDGRLAGSVLTLDCAVRNVMEFGKLKLREGVRLASYNPAHRLGMAHEIGHIVPGARADFVVLTPEGKVAQTILAGEVV